MAVMDTNVRERVAFLGQEPARLREFRGPRLYDALTTLGLSHEQYFRALGTNVDDYCAQEFGVDLRRITVERFFQSDPNAKWLFGLLFVGWAVVFGVGLQLVPHEGASSPYGGLGLIALFSGFFITMGLIWSVIGD